MGPDFDDQQTATYTPPVEQHTSWAPAGWGPQTPPHWLEPLPDSAAPTRRRSRGGSSVLPIFIVGLIAGVLGSLLMYGALMASGQIGKPAAVLTQPTPTPFVLASAGTPAADAAAAAEHEPVHHGCGPARQPGRGHDHGQHRPGHGQSVTAARGGHRLGHHLRRQRLRPDQPPRRVRRNAGQRRAQRRPQS